MAEEGRGGGGVGLTSGLGLGLDGGIGVEEGVGDDEGVNIGAREHVDVGAKSLLPFIRRAIGITSSSSAKSLSFALATSFARSFLFLFLGGLDDSAS